MCIDCETEITGKPVCFAARSAVRCLVPDSVVSIDASGSSWTAARTIRLASRSTTMAPSILASSRNRVEENSTSNSKPPEDRKSTRLNSSHVAISYAVFCLKKKKEPTRKQKQKVQE